MTQADSKTTGQVRAEKSNGIGWITFDSPSRRNALSLRMWEQLRDAAREFNADPQVRAVVIQGAGNKAFASGADITEFEQYRSNAEQKKMYGEVSGGAQQALRDIEKPVIALVRGYCIGGGLILAMSADLRMASANAKFGVPAARLGLGYEYANTAALARLVGPSSAKDILFSGRHLDAHEALRLGLVNTVHEDDAIEAAVLEYASMIARNAPLTVQTAKAAIKAFEAYSQSEQSPQIAELVDKCFNSDDYREGWKAFLEKRPPAFRGQ